MRKLNKKQKAMLDRLYDKGVKNADDISSKEWSHLERVNDHETLYQNADRYLMDKHFERLMSLDYNPFMSGGLV